MAWFDRSPGGRKIPTEDPHRPDFSLVGPEEKASPEPVSEDPVAHLYKGSRVTGQLTFHGPATINGTVEGEVLCHGVLTIGEEAEVRAKISAEVVVIRGKVEGDVTAKQKVELEAPARLLGNIAAPRLIVAEGVVLDGDCSMGTVRGKGEVPSPLRSSSEKTFESEASKVTELEK
ncbi:MAG: bactofilin family protein [Candidatus Binatia bacterium]